MANSQILTALENLDVLTTAEQTVVLNAIVSAGHDITAFTKALKDNQTLWNKCDDLENADFNEGFLTADGRGDVDKLETLFQLAVEKRVILGLQSAGEDVLKKVIASAEGQPLRTLLATNPIAAVTGEIHKAPGWAVDNETYLTNDATKRIKQKAQGFLLINKIKTCPPENISKVDDLLKTLNEGNDANFINAAKALGVDNISTDVMKHDIAGFLIRGEAAKMSFTTKIVDIFSEHYALNVVDRTDPYLELNKSDADFIDALPEPYNLIEATDAASIKGILGGQYLREKINHMTLDKAVRVAKTNNVEQMRGELKGEPEQEDAFRKLAVNEKNLAGFRHLAAVRALKLEIERSYDMKDLKALASVSTLAAGIPVFNTILEKSPSFGFAGEQGTELRNAFTKKDTSALVAIIPVAHVRYSLLTGTADQLQTLLKTKNTEEYTTGYINVFPYSPRDYFDKYFGDAGNLLMTRQQALLAIARLKFAELDVAVLNNIVAGNDLREVVKTALNIPDDVIDDLINNDNNNSVNKGLIAHAKIGLLAAENNFNTLLEAVNDLREEVSIKNILPESNITDAQQKLTTILFAKCPADKVNDLVKITQAKNLVEMKAALTQLGITDQTWVTIENMKDLQKAALPHALELKVNTLSSLRPQLLALFKTFSPEKQQALITDEKLILAVMNSSDVSKIAKMLHINEKLVNKDTEFHKEFERVLLSSRIQNADMAKIIAGMPFVSLTDEKVKQINDLLIDRLLDFKNTNYVAVLGKVRDIVNPSMIAEFNTNFGLAADGLTYTGDRIIRAGIINQYHYNEATATQLRFDIPEKAVYQFIASLYKGAALPTEDSDKIVVALKAAKSKKDFIEKVKAIADPAIHADTIKSLEQKLSQDIFNKMKHPIAQANFLNTNTLPGVIKADKSESLEHLTQLDKLTAVDRGIRDELERLAGLSAMSWLDPAFQSAAHQNAYAMKQRFVELSDACDIIVINLADKNAFYQNKLDSLPSKESIEESVREGRLNAVGKDSIEAHRTWLIKHQANVAKDLDLYKKIQTIMQGNPNKSENIENILIEKGILKMLDEAMEGKPLKFLGYESKCKAYKKSEIEAHFRPGYKGAKAEEWDKEGMEALGVSTKGYAVDPDNMQLGSDEFFEHTIGTGAAEEGYFIEERGSRDRTAQYKPGKSGDATAVDFPIEVKLRVNKFPADEKGHIQMSMAMASKLLAGATPSLENKILLQGTDKEKIKHLWTALMTQLMATGMRAGVAQELIVVRCPTFNPANEMGTLVGLSSDSLYETVYKNHPAVVLQKGHFKELCKDLTDSEKPKKEAVRDVQSVTEKFRGAKEVINDMKNKNTENNIDNDNETPTIRFR